MNILSLDASTRSTGFAIFKDKELKEYGCITASSTDLVKRINKMITELNEILTREREIDKIILEEVRPEQGLQNIKTHKALMYLQAAITFLIHERFSNIEIIYLYPSEWRAACQIHTGRGIRRQSLKPADIKFVKDTYNIEVNDDTADAIGLGYAYTHPKPKELNWGK